MVRWRNAPRSGRVEDRRGMSGGVIAGGGITTLVIVIGAMLLGVDPSALLQSGAANPGSGPAVAPGSPTDSAGSFVDHVLGDTEATWSALFAEQGQQYQPAVAVLFTDAVRTGCGVGQAAMGPFYCPLDQKLYLDLSFFDELSKRFGAPGDFAQAYVIAHEVGHHVQTITGTSDRVRQMQANASQAEANRAQVMMELQADCYAGIWGHHAEASRDLLERGDIEEGLAAAAAIGDDALQRQAGRGVNPESFTHGSSAQRSQWFRRGLDTGDPTQCDTFTLGV